MENPLHPLSPPDTARVQYHCGASDGSSTLEILTNLLCVLAIEPLEFLVELHVALIDVRDVGIVVVGPATAEFRPLFDSVEHTRGETRVNTVDSFGTVA